MAKKFFTKTPDWIIGLIFVIGSMLDGIAAYQILDKSPYWAIAIIALRAGINRVEILYTVGLTNMPPDSKNESLTRN